MNFSSINFGNNFMSMHQFSTATKAVGNIHHNVAFIPATGSQHYLNTNNSNHVNFSNNVQVTSAVLQHQNNYQDSGILARIINQNVASQLANTTTTSSTSAQTQWNNDPVNQIPNDIGKVNLSNCQQSQETQITQTTHRTSRTVLTQSVSTMTDLEYPATLKSKCYQKDNTTSEDSDDSSKSWTKDNQTFQESNCSNSCSKINLKINASAMAEYLCRLQPYAIPQNIQEFLKKHNVKIEPTEIESDSSKKDSEDESVKLRTEVRLSKAIDGSLLYCCAECHMVYPHKDLLERHLSVHRAERRFECNVCGVYLKRKEHLDQHKRGHSEERPFVCEICCKGFKRNEHLRRHIVIHSGDKSHVCANCGKAFSRKDHLNKHLQTHVGKRVKV